MTSLVALVYRLLDWLVDDQWARYNVVRKEGLVIRGEWKTGRLFVHGEELEPDGWAERVKPWGQLRNPTPKFRWGSESSENHRTALAILAWFLDEPEIRRYRADFATDVVCNFPEQDFELTFNYVGWKNGNVALWRWE